MVPEQLQKKDNTSPDERRIELGWLLAHELSATDLDMVLAARQRVIGYLLSRFSQFEWHMPLVWRAKPVCQQSIEPSQLLIEGSEERYIRNWDFALVVTHADLRSYYKPFAMAVPSRAISVAAVSIARLQQDEIEEEKVNEQHRREITIHRLFSLTMHLLDDLNGLPHSEESNDFMYEPVSANDLEFMVRLPAQLVDHFPSHFNRYSFLEL